MIFIEYCDVIFLWEKKVKIDSTLLILGMFTPFGGIGDEISVGNY